MSRFIPARQGLRRAGLVLALIVGLLALTLAASPYLRRWTFLGFIDVQDYTRLPSRPVAAGGEPARFEVDTAGDWIAGLGVRYQGRLFADEADLGQFLREHASTAFIVIKDGRILDERYFNGSSRESYFKSFSVTKSVLSAMIGIAVSEGLIGSANDPISKYLPELEDPSLRQATLRHCLDNTVGIDYTRGAMPWRGQPRMYYTTDVRGLVRDTRVAHIPGTALVQEDISPLVLGCVLERALQSHPSRRTMSEYLSEKIWRRMGAEYDALWNIDRATDGIEKTESGLCARAIDLARFGHLYLEQGRRGAEQIVPASWIRDTIARPAEGQPNVWNDGFFRSLWWGTRLDAISGPDYYANGHFGQRLYVSPGHRLVLVRLGSDNAGIDWTAFLGAIADAFERAGNRTGANPAASEGKER